MNASAPVVEVGKEVEVDDIEFDVEHIRADFPILEREVDGRPLVYLDSANTSQKPRCVVEAIEDHYLNHNANVARAMHVLGAEATAAFEGGRQAIAGFIGAARPEEVVFTKNASEALNLCAHVLGSRLKPGDEIVISVLEHHSNIVPWQLLAERTGATLRWFDVTEEGRLDLVGAAAEGLINERTKIISVAHVSNVLGTVNPVREIAALGHAVGATVILDASQAVPQLPIDVQDLGADLVAFTGHKMVGPTGIGVLWGRYDLLAELPPFLGGGEMIEVVKMTGSTYAPPPHRFEAGTPPIAQAVGLGAAVGYLSAIGMDAIAAHEQEITAYALEGLKTVPGLRILGPSEPVDRGGAVSFTVPGIHPHDVSQLLDSRGIAVRGGHHCARPLHERFGVQSSTRASFYLYTTKGEIDALVDGLGFTQRFFGG
ncbi:cysteine desulfurase/selenocysteine lyase [Microlunatus phosphovorus NM-1]|uniref:cysteine desulfurase n=1 Tax=Microlunatus phosphovorus (strain ATCC 700054 / DSM 10555 / JCM 9379 / NBRC 101784 / NCIMB 13414 / VKM Ac-1990 / NM-1) TaxID=1032480 RepID=F5XQG7_MICPN|nr:cysteine desulfurase/selenocysteine lyase [Microlunatus phosphovorus NM-1]